MARLAEDHVARVPIAETIDWSVALVPVLLLVALFVWLDVFKLMQLSEIGVLLLLGAVAALASYPISGVMLDQLPLGFSFYSRVVAPWIEEAVKALGIIALFRLNRIGYKLDAVISGFAIGAGFSVVENMIYLARFPELGASVWMVRGLGTAVMHGCTLAVLAAIAHELAERENREATGDFNFNLFWFLPGYLFAVALHTVFNQFPDRPLLAMMGALVATPILLMSIFQFGTDEAQKWLAAESSQHRAELETLRSGQWPDGAAGNRIAALAERLGPAAATRIRRYWEVQAWLVVEAEQAMLDEASGDVVLASEKIAASFAELAAIEAALGRSGMAALKPLLPFSRNDHWEVRELRQRTAVAAGKKPLNSESLRRSTDERG
ncbi:MAG: PrsW family intramembrane metalloprotease, partial [Pseudomonadota bacterium]|nr:PrsW family intramembrane metalloprotease [Pseudomonadota bacterium]